jgi:DNA replication licensing factor MCM2
VEEEEDDGEDLFGDDMMRDYREMGAMDEYEAEGLDENVYDDIDFGARAAAEAALAERDVRERASRMPAALMTSDDEGDDRPQRRRRRQEREPALDGEEQDPAAFVEELLDDEESGINLEDYSGPLSEWVNSAAVSDEIRRRFRRFLHRFEVSDGAEGEGGASSSKYAERVRAMCAANSESLEVSYLHLSSAVPILAIWVADCPTDMLKLLDEAAMEAVRIMFPNYHEIHEQIHVRVTELPIHDSIRDLRQARVQWW